VLADDHVRVEVADSGRWKHRRARPDRGLGLRLIEGLMETVDLNSDDRGTRVVMKRRLDGSPRRDRVDGRS
jgi:anti-sigma regulatory factor (Ser/Thr protein kinase)